VEKRQLREFQEGLDFIRAKRHPTPQRIDAWRKALDAQVETTGGVDVSLLVYSAHLGLVEEAYQVAETARLGPTVAFAGAPVRPVRPVERGSSIGPLDRAA
jgi:hypothetical protein